MTDDMFERIRQRRKEALAESLRHRNEYFNPYRCGPIVELAIEPEADSVRAKVTLNFSDGMVKILPHFYLAHASHMIVLCPADRTEYLRSIWLNYSRARGALSRPSQ